MNIPNLLRWGVALADRFTETAQVTVLHKALLGRGSNDVRKYATTATPRLALVEMKQRTYTSRTGDTLVADGKITLLRNVTIGNEDELTLPDGRVVTVLYVDDPLLDPAGGGYLRVVFVGASTGIGIGG